MYLFCLLDTFTPNDFSIKLKDISSDLGWDFYSPLYLSACFIGTRKKENHGI